MTTLVAVVLVGSVSYLMRASMLVGLASTRLPVRIETALSSVAPAIIAVIVSTSFLPDGASEVRPDLLVAAAAALVVARRTGHLIGGALAGMVCIWIAALTGLS